MTVDTLFKQITQLSDSEQSHLFQMWQEYQAKGHPSNSTPESIRLQLQQAGLLAEVDYEEDDLPLLSEAERADISNRLPYSIAHDVNEEREDRL